MTQGKGSNLQSDTPGCLCPRRAPSSSAPSVRWPCPPWPHHPKLWEPGAFLLLLPTGQACSCLRTLALAVPSLPSCFHTTGSRHSGHSPKSTSSEKPSVNYRPQPSLAKALSGGLQKCCVAASPKPHIHPLQTAFQRSGQRDRLPNTLPTRNRPPSTLRPHALPRCHL